MEVISLINLNLFVTKLDGVNNDALTDAVLKSRQPSQGDFVKEEHHSYFEDTILPPIAEVQSFSTRVTQEVSDLLCREYFVESIWGLTLFSGESVMAHSHKSNQHLHPSEFYSIAYYPQVPSGSADLIFSLNYCNTIETTKVIKPEEGMLIVFNSYIPHMTSRHRSEDPRVVISANLAPLNINKQIYPERTIDRCAYCRK
ncbi:MAG: hypothetical protein RL563_2883 [Pseudomonadota bacterium]|jgi:hypothetical protein